MMRIYQPIPIERLLIHLIQNDRDITKLHAQFEIEKDEIIEIMIQHFHELGIFIVHPGSYWEVIKKHLEDALLYSPELNEKREQVRKRIKKVREKSRRTV